MFVPWADSGALGAAPLNFVNQSSFGRVEPGSQMITPSTPTSLEPIRGTITEAEVKVSVDPARPLPLACALYAIESAEGVWLCAYYGSNRSNFDFLPQKGAEVDETRLGIVFHAKQFVPKEQYNAGLWEEFRKTHLKVYGGGKEG